jgi:esterase/lipase superfamily enzyme
MLRGNKIRGGCSCPRRRTGELVHCRLLDHLKARPSVGLDHADPPLRRATRAQWPPAAFLPSAVGLLVLALAGCQTHLMPTPNIYASGKYQLYGELDPSLRTNQVDLLYVTDRAPIEKKDRVTGYGYRRSRSLAFGSAVVEIGHGVSWDALVQDSTSRERKESLPLKVGSITELGRFPHTPWPLVERRARLVDDPAVAARHEEVAARFGQEVRRRLALTPYKGVFIYVHGFNTTFDYAAAVVAEFWHFGGRLGVPILYSWPAGSPGLLRAYTHDRESSQFTIHHLKQFIRAVASISEVQRIHVIAHSRGTGVAANALHELLIEDRAAGRDLRQSLRIGEVILASPDLDLGIFFQRFVASRFYQVAEHITVYCSQKDKALGLAESLFNSRPRLGEVRPKNFSEDEKQLLSEMHAYDIVDARVKTGFLGHGYYHSNPAASSDLILLLRYRAVAGSEQRPLTPAIPGYWELASESYPFPDAALK